MVCRGLPGEISGSMRGRGASELPLPFGLFPGDLWPVIKYDVSVVGSGKEGGTQTYIRVADIALFVEKSRRSIVLVLATRWIATKRYSS